jgi:hypothetical protein
MRLHSNGVCSCHSTYILRFSRTPMQNSFGIRLLLMPLLLVPTHLNVHGWQTARLFLAGESTICVYNTAALRETYSEPDVTRNQDVAEFCTQTTYFTLGHCSVHLLPHISQHHSISNRGRDGAVNRSVQGKAGGFAPARALTVPCPSPGPSSHTSLHPERAQALPPSRRFRPLSALTSQPRQTPYMPT